MAAAFRLSDSQRERGVVIGGDDLTLGSPAFIRVLPRAGEPAISLYERRRGRHRTAGASPVFASSTTGTVAGRVVVATVDLSSAFL